MFLRTLVKLETSYIAKVLFGVHIELKQELKLKMGLRYVSVT